jgi:hypothetical protein
MPNSNNTTIAKELMQALHAFAEKENKEGRPVNVDADIDVLPSYWSLYPTPDDIHKIDEGATLSLIGGSRLLPLDVFEGRDENVTEALIDVIANAPKNQGYPGVILLHGKHLIIMIHILFYRPEPGFFFCYYTRNGLTSHLVAGNKVSQVAPDTMALHPYWRTATHSLFFMQEWDHNTSFEERHELKQKMTYLVQSLAEIVPDAGSYLNEYVKSHSLSCFFIFIFIELLMTGGPLEITDCFYPVDIQGRRGKQ